MDLWWFIMFVRALRHWDPMLSLPKRMSVAIVNIRSCSCCLRKLIWGWTSYYLMLWFFWLTPLDLGLVSAGGLGGDSLLGGSDWFDFGKKEWRVIAWGVAAGPDQRAGIHIGYACWQKADLIQAIRFELVVELLLGESHCLVVYYLLAGINWFVMNIFVVQSWSKEDHLDGRVMEVFELILACFFYFDHVFYLLHDDLIPLFLFVCLAQYHCVKKTKDICVL